MIKASVLAVMTLSLLRACGGDTEPSVEAPTQAAFAMNATHGGSVLFLNNGWAEVVPKSDGSIEAYVVDTVGAPMPAPMTATVSVKVHGDDGAQHTVVLPWNPASSRYEGRLEEARPVPGPMEVTVVAPGRPRWFAVAPTVVIIDAPLRPVGAPPVVVVERPRPQVDIQVTGPSVVIEATDEHGHGRGHGHGHGHHGHEERGGVIVVGPHVPGPGVIVLQPGGHGPGHGGGHGHGRGHH